MQWTPAHVMAELGKIHNLKAIRSATLDDGDLRIETKGLRHKRAWFKLAPIIVRIPLDDEVSPVYKYVHESDAKWHPHPVLNGRQGWKIGTTHFRSVCMGEGNAREYVFSHAQGPLMAVIQQLAMLQTIKDDPNGKPRSEVGFFFAIASILVGCSILAAIILTNLITQ